MLIPLIRALAGSSMAVTFRLFQIDMQDIIKILTERIKELEEQEWHAKEAKDYTACMYTHGAIIQLKKLLKEIEGD